MDGKDEYELFLKPLVSMVYRSCPGVAVLVDHGYIEDAAREFEEFEVFFAVPNANGQEIDPKTIDGYLLLRSITSQAAEAITNRFAELSPGYEGPIQGIGISTDTEWLFDDEVIEAEPMLGDFWEVRATPGLVRLYARFVAPVEQLEHRCTTAPRPLPQLPEETPYIEDPFAKPSFIEDEDDYRPYSYEDTPLEEPPLDDDEEDGPFRG